MGVNIEQYQQIMAELGDKATLIAVSKTKPAEDIETLYAIGHRDFGENYVQEMLDKHLLLPADIRWHFIGHLQTNKVKQVIPVAHLIHGVDSPRLLEEINKQAVKLSITVNLLLQVHIAKEETKFGLDETELHNILQEEYLSKLMNVRISGLMGMASFTTDQRTLIREFRTLQSCFEKYKSVVRPNVHFDFLSMGMSADYQLAVQEGSNMVRIGSLLFGAREKK